MAEQAEAAEYVVPEKVGTLAGLYLLALQAKGYTAAQIAAIAEILGEVNSSLEELEAHASSPHAPASAEENVIVAIKKNGSAVAPVDKIVDLAIPVKTSDITNDSNFVSQSAMQSAIDGAGHLKKLVVSSLPAKASADPDTIYYLLRSGGGVTGDQYDEYQLINGEFEIVGCQRQDLDPYAKTADLAKASDALIQSIVNTKNASSEAYIGAGNLARFWTLIQPYLGGSDLADLTSRVRLLELVVFNDEIEGNPYMVTFEDLEGLSVAGVWNTSNNTVEF